MFLPILLWGQTWDYPVKAGTEEWMKMESGQERLKACQIPVSVLNSISSLELAKLCMKYPLFYEYTAYDDEREGIKRVIEGFNGLKELGSRKDGTMALMTIYSQMQVQTDEGYVEKGSYNSVLNFEYIELLLSTDIFQRQLNVTEQQKLKKITLSKYAEKLKYVRIYGGNALKRSLLLSSILTNKIKPNNKDVELLNEFIQNYELIDNRQLEVISKINVQDEN